MAVRQPDYLNLSHRDIPELGLRDSSYDSGLAITPPDLYRPSLGTPGPLEIGGGTALATVPGAPPTARVTTPAGDIFAPVLGGARPPGEIPPPTKMEPFAPVYSSEGQRKVSGLLDDLEGFSGIRIFKDWRERYTEDPADFYRDVAGVLNTLIDRGATPTGHHIDQKLAQRIQDWLGTLKNTLGAIKAPSSPLAGLQEQQQKFYQTGLERLAQAGAYGGRGAEEELLASLSSRGLLDSGIAARELERFRAERFSHLSDAAAALNQQLLQSGLNLTSQEYLDRLVSGLSLQNQMALLQKQQEIAKSQQPDFWTQVLGTGIGVALPALLSPRSPTMPVLTPDPSGFPTPPSVPVPAEPYGLRR